MARGSYGPNVALGLASAPSTPGLMSGADKTALAAAAAAQHTHANIAVLNAITVAYTAAEQHGNKAILDAITAAYTAAEQAKLAGIAAGAQVNVVPTSLAGGAGLTGLTFGAGFQNICSVALPAGQWLIQAQGNVYCAGATTRIQAEVQIQDNGGTPIGQINRIGFTPASTAEHNSPFCLGSFLCAGGTTYWLKAAYIGGGGQPAYIFDGYISAVKIA
jgi:hypothetical protein